MITEIIKEAKLTGTKDERLPYQIGNHGGAEVLNQRIPFVEDILRSELSEIIAVSYDK